MQTLEAQIQAAAALIRRASRVVALTGAGISTPSGIPDFRSPNSGLWNHTNPMDVASIMAFRQRPIDFYDWVRPLARKVKEAKPNPAHYALADLEAAGKLRAIITQNIDGLHQAANSKKVLEVHGHNREMTCLSCYTVKEAEPIFEQFLLDGEVPYCECGGVLKPNVILFGEQLPVQTLHQAKAAVAEADLLIIAGSSLEVAPISDLPGYALEQNTPIIIINDQDTYIDPEADLVIHHELTEALPKIVQLALN
jgi:NAD-dependent deacetylase